MAEALGLASSIVALVQLSASVYSATSKFYREAKEAKSKIGALATQTRNLSGILQSLSLLATSPLFDDAVVSVPDFRDTYIESCHTTLYKIKRKLEKAELDFESGSHRKRITRSLKWPFASQETKDLIDELDHHRDVLQLALSADTMSHLLQCLVNTDAIAKGVDNVNRKLDRKASIDARAELTAKREEIVRFFLKVNPEEHLQDCRDRREPKTGKWLIERDQTFRNWMISPGARIWLNGIPGAGKTILCGSVVEEILQEQSFSTAVAFFFCDHKSTDSQKSVNILASIAVQLGKQADPAFELLEAYHEELHPANRVARPPETRRMIEVVQAMINVYDRVYLAIDGLDECGSSVVEVLQSLKQLELGGQLNMALFSREEPDIMEELSDSPQIEIAAHIEDLELYVLSQMESRKRLGSLAVKNSDLHEHICRTLIQGANGMFRWVACQLDHLDSLPSDGRRRKALHELPPTLFETYDRILDRIMREDYHNMEICRRALRWIGLKDKTLNVLALCEALSIPDDEDVIDIEHLVDPDWVARSCSSLIRQSTHESDQPHFQFAHFTVREYLRNIDPQSKRSFFRSSNEEAIQDLFRTSLRFLTFPLFDQKPTITASEIQRMAERNEKHPFYPVAAGYMFCSRGEYHEDTHLSIVLEDEPMMRYAKALFSPSKTGIFLSWVLEATWHWPEVELREEDFFSIMGLLLAPGFSALHIAAMLSLPSVCAHLIENGLVNVSSCCRLGTPLHALLAGLNLMEPSDDFNYDPGLHYRNISANAGKKYDLPGKCLKLLLENGADTSLQWNTTTVFEMAINNSINTEDDKLWPLPLIIGPTSVTEDDIKRFAQDLIEESIERPILDAIVTLGSDPSSAPRWARLASLVQTSQMRDGIFAEGGQSPNDIRTRISDEDFTDAVRFSISQGLTDFLRDMLQDGRFRKDLRIQIRNSVHMPVLHFAIECTRLQPVELLLEAGCDPQVVHEPSGWTSLHVCAAHDTGEAAITSLLLKYGAIDSVKDRVGHSCWHIAAGTGNIPVLKALMDMSSDIKLSLATTSSTGKTPLASAIHQGQLDSAIMLLDHCESDTSYFQSNGSLLEKAAAIGSKDLFIRLLDKLREAGATEAIGNSKPLHNIGMLCSSELVDHLLVSWIRDRDSEALIKYLLHVNDDIYQDPRRYPSGADISLVVRGLLPPSHEFPHAEETQKHFWRTFCEMVVPRLTNLCDHKKSRCRPGLINLIFRTLIDTGLLVSYEQTTQLPCYKVLFQALLDRDDLNCSWIASSVHEVIDSCNVSGGLSNEVVCIELLSAAIEGSNVSLVSELLHRGIDVHASHGSLSPLEKACFTSSQPIFQSVLRHSKRSLITKPGSQGMTLLHWIIAANVPSCLDKTEQVLQLEPNIIDVMTDDLVGYTAMTLASAAGRQDIVQLLLSRGANPLHRAHNGWTLFHAAALSGNLGYIQSLDPTKTPKSFWMGLCDFNLSGSTAKPLMVKRMTATHIAARNGRSHFLNYLIRKKLLFNVNAVTEYPSLTPLHLACAFGHLEVVEILISCEANVNARDAPGLLPVEIAAEKGHFAIFKTLMKSGSEKPATRFGHWVERLMLKERENMEEAEFSKSMSQLKFESAIARGELELCQELVAKGQSINAKLPTHSYTPLVHALLEGQASVVDWLVSLGVEVTNPAIGALHPSLRCIASLSVHNISSTTTLTAIMTLALRNGLSWYGHILGPLHVAILDGNLNVLDAILSHIRNNDKEYRTMIEIEMIDLPTDMKGWRDRSALSILVNELNREEAFSDRSPWKTTMPSGSPLHWAIREDDLDAVRLLLQKESDVNQVDSSGHGPLKLAVSEACSEEIVKKLLSSGANPTDRLYAMIEATSKGDLEVIRILAEADPGILKAAEQFTMGGLLNKSGSVEVFQYLLSQGLRPLDFKIVDVSLIALNADADEFSAFIFNSGLLRQATEGQVSNVFSAAVVEDKFPILKRLHHVVSADLSVVLLNRTMYGGPSALCAAASRNAGTIVEQLIAMGAEIDFEGSSYGSPLMTACALGCFDVVRRLVRLGAALCYVNEDGLLRNAVTLSLGHQELLRWFLVERHLEQRKPDNQPGQFTPQQVAWSGPRAFKLDLPTYVKRDFGESRWSHLRRLQKWKEGLLGATLAESRRNSGLDSKAELEAESKTNEAQAAHRQFLARLGED